eukprot:SAG25_NODE_7189_length_498_cov_0.822055_1_plen_66_part_00
MVHSRLGSGLRKVERAGLRRYKIFFFRDLLSRAQALIEVPNQPMHEHAGMHAGMQAGCGWLTGSI